MGSESTTDLLAALVHRIAKLAVIAECGAVVLRPAAAVDLEPAGPGIDHPF